MSRLQLYLQQGNIGKFWYDNFKQVPTTAAENWGRSTQSFVKFSFLCSFLLRATNTKHLIDTEESLKLLHKNKISYVQPGWKMLSKMIIYFYWCTSKYDVFLSVNWLSHYKSRKLFMKKSFTSGIVSKLQRPLQISK